MSKKKKAQQYGKPYTAKDFRQAAVGLFIIGVIAILFGTFGYLYGSEEVTAQTKVGTETYMAREPHDPGFMLIAVAGGVTIVPGIFFWIRSRKHTI